MREAGKKKMGTQLPHLWNPHKIKKIRQDETEIQNINWGGTCTRRLSPLGRKRLALAGRDMCRKNPLSVAPHHRFGYRSIHSDLCPHHRGNTLDTHFLNTLIYEKKKQDNRTAMQILRGGQHLRVYGIGLPKRKQISLLGTIQGTQSARQKGVYHLSLFRGRTHTYPRNHFSNNLNT